MRITLVGAVALGLWVSIAGAEEFHLRHDATDTLYGPFQTDAGAKVAIGTTTFTVVKQTSPDSSVEAKLDAIGIPSVELRHTTLPDAVDFLKKQAAMLDPQRTGVNFVIADGPSLEDTPADDPFGGLGAGSGTEQTITLSLKDVSALHVLKAFMEQTGYTYKTTENTVTIYPSR